MENKTEKLINSASASKSLCKLFHKSNTIQIEDFFILTLKRITMFGVREREREREVERKKREKERDRLAGRQIGRQC